MTLNLSVPEQDELKPRITVFGVGGAGGNAVDNMIEKKLDGVEFVVAKPVMRTLPPPVCESVVDLGCSVKKSTKTHQANFQSC